MRLPIEKLPEPLRKAYNWVKVVFSEYNDDNGGIVAAAISFYAFISLIPLALVAVAVFGFVLGSQEQSRELVLRNLERALPGAGASESIKGLIGGIIAGSTPAGIIGVLVLLWTGSSVFVNLGSAMDIAWDSGKQRSFLMGRALAIGMLVIVGILLLLSLGLSAGVSLLRRQEIFGFSVGRIPFIWQFLAYAVPPLISVTMFTLIYKILPTAAVPFKAALVGGVAAGISWEILKVAFTWYLTSFASFGEVYGSLASVIVLVLWIFYSSIIAVLGAETSQVYAQRALRHEG